MRENPRSTDVERACTFHAAVWKTLLFARKAATRHFHHALPVFSAWLVHRTSNRMLCYYRAPKPSTRVHTRASNQKRLLGFALRNYVVASFLQELAVHRAEFSFGFSPNERTHSLPLSREFPSKGERFAFETPSITTVNRQAYRHYLGSKGMLLNTRAWTQYLRKKVDFLCGKNFVQIDSNLSSDCCSVTQDLDIFSINFFAHITRRNFQILSNSMYWAFQC